MRRFVEIDGRRYLWREILNLRREQREEERHAQLALFELKEDRRPASGVVGGSYVVHAAPDGYTLLVSGISEVQNLFYIHVPYNAAKDFAPVGKIANGPPLVLAVLNSSPFKRVADLIAYAKANPTKTNIATTGPATSPAIAVSQLNAVAEHLTVARQIRHRIAAALARQGAEAGRVPAR